SSVAASLPILAVAAAIRCCRFCSRWSEHPVAKCRTACAHAALVIPRCWWRRRNAPGANWVGNRVSPIWTRSCAPPCVGERRIPTAMATDREPGTLVACALAAAILLWPAAWNGYPLVFADTGTYLSQAIEHYIGWDRPVFYSLFLLPLHMTLTTWPVIA